MAGFLTYHVPPASCPEALGTLAHHSSLPSSPVLLALHAQGCVTQPHFISRQVPLFLLLTLHMSRLSQPHDAGVAEFTQAIPQIVSRLSLL